VRLAFSNIVDDSFLLICHHTDTYRYIYLLHLTLVGTALPCLQQQVVLLLERTIIFLLIRLKGTMKPFFVWLFLFWSYMYKAKFLKTTKGVTDESVHSHQSHQEPASNSKTNSPAGLSSQVKRTAWPGS
jgi:hypothetical protein